MVIENLIEDEDEEVWGQMLDSQAGFRKNHSTAIAYFLWQNWWVNVLYVEFGYIVYL